MNERINHGMNETNHHSVEQVLNTAMVVVYKGLVTVTISQALATIQIELM